MKIHFTWCDIAESLWRTVSHFNSVIVISSASFACCKCLISNYHQSNSRKKFQCSNWMHTFFYLAVNSISFHIVLPSCDFCSLNYKIRMGKIEGAFSSVQFSSVVQSCLTLFDPMNCSMRCLPVHHQLPEPTQTHVHWVSDATQPSHPLSVPFSSCPQSFPASGSFQMSQLFASGGQSIGASASTSVLPMNTQDWSPLGWTDWILGSPRDSQESFPIPQKEP